MEESSTSFVDTPGVVSTTGELSCTGGTAAAAVDNDDTDDEDGDECLESREVSVVACDVTEWLPGSRDVNGEIPASGDVNELTPGSGVVKEQLPGRG